MLPLVVNLVLNDCKSGEEAARTMRCCRAIFINTGNVIDGVSSRLKFSFGKS